MKKLKNKQIFGILTAFGFAATPIVSVLAETGDGQMSFTDTVVATVDNSCGIYDAYTSSSINTPVTSPKEYSATVAPGEFAEWGPTLANKASDVFVVCNDANGWSVSAVGTGEGKTVDMMDASTGENDDLISGTDFTGATGMWAFLVGKGINAGNLDIAEGYGVYHAIPTISTKVISSATATDVSSGEFTTGYKVYIGTETPAGTYTGQVTYTLAHPAVGGGRDEDMEDGGETKNGESEETKGGGEVKEEPKEESKGGNEESQGGSSEEGSPVGPLMTSVYNNTYSNVYNNYNTTGGTNEGDGGSLASNESGKTVSDAEKLKSGEEKALGVVAKTGGEGKKAEDDNTGWIVLGMTAAVVAAGAATGIYIYKTKEA